MPKKLTGKMALITGASLVTGATQRFVAFIANDLVVKGLPTIAVGGKAL